MSPAIRLFTLLPKDWQLIKAHLRNRLTLLGHEHLLEPITQTAHELLNRSIHGLHTAAFGHIMAEHIGIRLDPAAPELAELLTIERREHGDTNLQTACTAHEWFLEVRLCDEHDGREAQQHTTQAATQALIELHSPISQLSADGINPRLIEAAALQLQVSSVSDGGGSALSLRLKPTKHEATAIAPETSSAGFTEVALKLGYGLIRFSRNGRVLSASPHMLALLNHEQPEAPLPAAFYTDIVWGAALASETGIFENYRLRLSSPESPAQTTLFNISGFRESNGDLLTMWQSVSQGGAALSEGSMLNEARVHNITRRYVPQLVERKAREAIRLGQSELHNEIREIAILFCDIVGFTSYVETQSADESTINTLNTILRRIAGAVRKQEGSIDKFMGDCMMALFDTPVAAVEAAIDMQQHALDLNTLRHRAGQQVLQLRIGIHWGEVVIGNVGTSERLDWTTIGDVVNTASRIEKCCNPGAILVSEKVQSLVLESSPSSYVFEAPFKIKVKGKQELLTVCHVQHQAYD